VSGAIIAAVTPLILLAAGLVALVAGWIVLSSFGPKFRVGRLLASTPSVSVAEALAMSTGPDRYVRISGRLDAEDEFEDDAHRPLVLRRTRLFLRDGRRWRAIEDRREMVPFWVRDGLDAIAVDADVLDAGLVVIPRESVGTAGDAPDRAPAGTDPTTPLRLLVEQVSSIEHSIVLGVPARGPDGMPRISAGLGRPLVLTTLERDEAMRILAGSGSRRPLVAAICMGGGLVLISLALAWALFGAIA
jgi:hypothetical protein